MLDDDHAFGVFYVDRSVHLRGHGMSHLAAVETQICINQLLMVFVESLVSSGRIHEWGKLKWSEYWGKISTEHFFIVKEKFKFSKMIEPGRLFIGTCVLKKEFKSKHGNYHFVFNFSFYDGAHTAEVDVVFLV
jgi:hypothetical protein